MNWNDTRAIVTGACGFIGSHLTEALVRRGAKVRALAIYDSRGAFGWLDELAPDVRASVELVAGDVRDAEQMRRLILPDSLVFHLAALIGIPYSYEAPRSYLETNLTGTLNVLEAARNTGARRVFVTSTSEVYGSALRVPIDEEHPLQAQSPYSASKIAAEKLAESYFRSFQTPVTVVRPFNTYGPRQSPRAVIPTILIQLLSGVHELVLGDVTTTRDFNFVDDTVEGFLRLAECDQAIGQVVNIGTGVDWSIRQIAEIAQGLLGRTVTIRNEPTRIRPEASEVRRLCAGNNLLKKLTGWIPPARLQDGLSRTADWLRPRVAKYDAKRYYV